MLLRSRLVLPACVLAVLAFLLAPQAGAAPVDSATAQAAASRFLARAHATALVARVSDLRDGNELRARVFSLTPRGYVAVSGDDLLPPVVAYSFESDYPAGAPDGNPLAQMLTADLRNRLAAMRTDPAAAPQLAARIESLQAANRLAWDELLDGSRTERRFQQWPPAGSTPTGGWLQGNWTQNPPYNALCPLDLAHSGARSLAGCPSVAMAMVLDYHKTIQGTTLGAGDRYWHAYAGNYYWIFDAWAQYGFPDYPTLNGYLQTLTSHWASGSLTNTDKAALVFACGVAERQVYSAAGSGTFGVDQAYAGYQRFAFTGCRLVHDTDPEMYPDLAQNMQDARPAHLAIVDPGWTMGHNVVVDGYNTDNYFHLNFGWGGPYNGWYLLPQEIPYGLTVVEGLILDIIPATTAAPESAPAILALSSGPNPSGGSAVLRFVAPESGRARVGIYDPAGRLVALLWNGELQAGPHAFLWNQTGSPNGVYLARVEVGNRVEATRLVLTR